MPVAIFTPTSRPGGLDVLEASLKRQTYKDFWWFVVDDLYETREDVWQELHKEFNITIITLGPKTKHRNLCEAYNNAAKLVTMHGDFDLFISLQDYIWVPPNGVKRFVDLHKKLPESLITGVTHISEDPEPSTIEYPDGKYSLWSKPYMEKPKKIIWHDVRLTEIYSGYEKNAVLSISDAGHFEANWAAIPVSKFRQGLFWNEEYDEGVAYENCDYAQRCLLETNCEIVFDTGNQAISLPHKDYFLGEREDIMENTNRWRYEAQWS